MSDTVNQTREEATRPPAHAIRCVGTGRLAWQWEGKCYTATGVHVPVDVIRQDDALITEGMPIPDDKEVLEMVVSLPEHALPPGAYLTPLDGSPPKQLAQPTDNTALLARIKELEDQNAGLIRDATAPPPAESPPSPPAPKGDAIDDVLGGQPGAKKVTK